MQVLNRVMTIDDTLRHDERYRYMMLGRLQTDCLYCIDHGAILRLFGGNVRNHIKYMDAIWHSFPKSGKPKWCKLKDIKEYGRQLKVIENNNKKR